MPSTMLAIQTRFLALEVYELVEKRDTLHQGGKCYNEKSDRKQND